MVVGMQHQQQQPHASPATGLEDASTPGAVSPQSVPTSLATSSVKKSEAQEKQESDTVNENECSSGPAVSVTKSNIVTETFKPKSENVAVKTKNEMPKICCSYPVKSTGRVKLRDVNPHLVCVLCHGYFVDATSIAECLHSFCRSCIILYLATKNYCPICEVQINSSKPHLSLKPDKTLQDIVYKLVPGLFHAEMKRRDQFYQDHPNRDLDLHPEFRGITVDRLVYSPHDSICISLVYYDKSREKEEWESVASRVSLGTTKSVINSDSDGDDDSPKKYLMCPAAVRVIDLKKLIRMKYSLDGRNKVELFFRRESLPDDYSLMDIAYIYAWKRNSPMQLFYKMGVISVLADKVNSAPVEIIDTTDVKSSQPTSALDMMDMSETCRNKSANSITPPESCKVSIQEGKPSLLVESSAPSPTTVTVTSTTTVVPINTITTPVYSTPRLSTKLKGSHGATDMKKCKQRSPVRCSDNVETSPIKSYLAISSIMNEIDKSDSKKVPLQATKNAVKKVVTNESKQVVSSASDSLKVPEAVPTCTPIKVPPSNSVSKRVSPVVPIVKSLTEVASSLAGKENYKRSEDVKPINKINKVVVKAKNVTSSAESVMTALSPSPTNPQAKLYKNVNAIYTSTNSSTLITQATASSAKHTLSTVTTNVTTSIQMSSSTAPISLTSGTIGNCIKSKQLPKLLPATDLKTAPIVSTDASTQSSPVNNSLSKAVTTIPILATTHSYSLMVSANSSIKPTTSTCIAKTVSVPAIPPLITLNTTNVHLSPKNVNLLNNYNGTEKMKCVNTVNKSVAKSKAVTSSTETLMNTSSLSFSKHQAKIKKNITPIYTSANHCASVTHTTTSSTKQTYTTVTTSAASSVQMSSSVAPTGVTSVTTGNSIKSKQLPKLLPATDVKTTSTVKSYATTIPVTNNTTNSTFIAKGVSIPMMPSLITLSTTNNHSSLTNVSSPLSKNSVGNVDPVNSFILSTNTKIPSSLEISLTLPKTVSNASSPMTNLQKMVQQNFLNSNTVASSHQQVNGGVKRSSLNNGEDGPKEKCTAYVGKTIKDDKKLGSQPQKERTSVQRNETSNSKNSPPKKIFSPDILPEVSITLNRHPESTNKRLSPETSYDVSCFKPHGMPNGIPPLMPINAHSVASKNIIKSPIKRSLINSLKTNRCSISPIADEDSKKYNGSAKDTAKRPRLGNGGKSPSPTTSAAASSKMYSTPIIMPNFYPDPMTVNLLRQQQWMFNVNCPVPPHPLMNRFVPGKSSAVQDTVSLKK